MDNPYRRYEMLLPRQFNSGEAVPGDLFADTILELRTRFGAVSSETQATVGHWEHQGQAYRDEHFRLYVDVPDTVDNRQYFVEFKERLKERFRQIDIWMTTYPLELL